MCNATSGVGLINNVSLHNANFQTVQKKYMKVQCKLYNTQQRVHAARLYWKICFFFFFFLILQINYLEYTLPKNNRKRLLILKIIVLNAKTLPCLLDSRNRVRSSETTDKDILGAERKEHAEHSQGKNMNNYSSLVILNSKKTSELRYSLPSLCEQRKNGH